MGTWTFLCSVRAALRRLRGRAPNESVTPVESFFQRPRLTDSGINSRPAHGQTGVALVLIVGLPRISGCNCLRDSLREQFALLHLCPVASESPLPVRSLDRPAVVESPQRAAGSILILLPVAQSSLDTRTRFWSSSAAQLRADRSRPTVAKAPPHGRTSPSSASAFAGARVGADVVCRTAGLKYYSGSGSPSWRCPFANLRNRNGLRCSIAEVRTTPSDAREFIAIVRQSLLQPPLLPQTVKEAAPSVSSHGQKVKARPSRR